MGVEAASEVKELQLVHVEEVGSDHEIFTSLGNAFI